ncbi:hypothetical protein [Geodermatophilus sp. SYSU D01176]
MSTRTAARTAGSRRRRAARTTSTTATSSSTPWPIQPAVNHALVVSHGWQPVAVQP